MNQSLIICSSLKILLVKIGLIKMDSVEHVMTLFKDVQVVSHIIALSVQQFLMMIQNISMNPIILITMRCSLVKLLDALK